MGFRSFIFSGFVSLVFIPWALADSSSSVMIVYGVDAAIAPKRSIWSGSAWGSSSSLSSVGAEPHWIVTKNCPTRNETACGTFDIDSDFNIMFYNGSSWTAVAEVETDGDENDDRNFDVAYEQSSGDCLIAYFDLSELNFGYRTYSGSSLSGESDLARTGVEGNDYVALYPKPDSNQIVMITLGQVSGADTISANIWSGSSWSGWTTISTSPTTNDNECFSFAFESSSGDGLLVYAEAGQAQPRYRTLSGTTWSGVNTMPTVGAPAWWIRLAADPASNQVLFASLDDQSDINVNAWNGSSWGSNSEVETDARPGFDTRCFDIAYEYDGTRALLAYIQNAQNAIRYRTWNGSSFSGETTSTDLGAQGRTVQLRTGTSGREIFVAASDDGEDVELMRWSGSMSAKTQIESNMGALPQCESFMISIPTASALVPANTPYAHTFESSMGAEWSSTTRTNDGTLTYYAGPHDDGTSLKLALNTTVAETYVLCFDFYAIDSWDGDEPTYGPDGFSVSVDTTQIFYHTFTHEFPAYGATYPFPADQTGNYELGSYVDGIYRKVQAVFTATSSVSTLTFAPQVVEDGSESWGIDNITVRSATFLDVSSAKNFDVQVSTNAGDSAGMHWADLDSDGDLDAILGGGNTSRLALFNWAAQTYTISTLGGGGIREQGALDDYDNDGDLDFWACEVSADGTQKLYKNNGSASFSDAGASGFSGAGTNEGCAAADTNQDGWGDLVVFSSNGNWIGHNQQSSSPAFVATISATYGMNDSGDYGSRGDCAAGDVNNDGILDFFYRYSNGKLFVSDGDGTYTENARGISVLTGGTEDLAAAWGDYDNNGKLDLFVPRVTAGYTGGLWRNDVNWTVPSGTFTDVSSSAGLNLNAKTVPSTILGARSGCWGDYDNDGDLDLFIVGANSNCLLYQNQGSGVLSRVGVGTDVAGSAHDAAFVDIDNDGDLDLAITMQSANCVLLQNRTNNSNYLKVRLIGRGSGGTSKAAIGTRVELWNSAGTTLLARRDVGVARGYGGTEPLWLHFGGVTPSTNYQIKAYFNSGTMTQSVTPNAVSTTFGSRSVAQMLTINEPTTVKITKWYEVPNKP